MAFTQASAWRKALALFTLVMLAVVSSAGSWNAGPVITGGVLPLRAVSIHLQNASASTSFGYVYPSESESSLAASANFTMSVLVRLGLTSLTPMAFNGSASPDDFQNQTNLPDGSYVNGPVVRYSNGAAWASFKYSPGGRFMGLSVVNAAPLYSGPTDADKVNSTRAIVVALGLPLGNDSTWTVYHEPALIMIPVPRWQNETVVQIGTSIRGLNLTLANSLYIRFMDSPPYAAIRLDVSAWFVADWSAMLPAKTLEAASDHYVRSQNESRNWTIQSIEEVGLVPFPDMDTFGLLFALPLSKGASLAQAMVYVDAWSGLVLRWAFLDLSPEVVHGGPAGLGQMTWLAVIGLAAGIALVGFGALFRGVESVRYRTLLLAARLSAFVERTEIDNFTRGQILGCIVAVPGITYSQLSKKLGIANGVLTYHLSVLEKEGFLRPRRVGVHKCFYPLGWKEPTVEPMVLSQVQRSVLELVRQQPGISPGEIATRLALHRRNVSYNVGRLANTGFLEVTRLGRKKSCRLARNPETQTV